MTEESSGNENCIVNVSCAKSIAKDLIGSASDVIFFSFLTLVLRGPRRRIVARTLIDGRMQSRVHDSVLASREPQHLAICEGVPA